MVDTCRGVEYATKVKKGTYGSEWFKCDDRWDEADAIEKFIKQHLKVDDEAQEACEGGCDILAETPSELRCRPIGIGIKDTKEKPKVTLKRVETKVRRTEWCAYLLVVEEDSKVRVTTRCSCI
jgi:hypothetical protein